MERFRYLRPDEVEVRVGTCSEKGVSLLLYKTARVDMQLLDETVGPDNWQCRYELIGDDLFCSVGIKTESGEWIWKADTGTENTLEPSKSRASDAFKRAGFKCGIGRELYTAPFVWVGSDKCSVKQGKNGRWQCYDRFAVTEMEVEDGAITKLSIANMSRRGQTVYGAAPAQPKPQQENPMQAAKRRMWAAVTRWAELQGRDPMNVLEGVKKRPDWSESEEFFERVAQEFEDGCNG